MKRIYITVVLLATLSAMSFAQTTTRSLTWNLTGAKNWPTVGTGNNWDNKANWVISGTGTAPATNVTNGDKLIIPNVSGVVINVTTDMPIALNNFVIEVQGNAVFSLQSGVDFTMSGSSTAFSLANAGAGGLTLVKRQSAVNPTQLIIKNDVSGTGLVKALNSTNSDIQTAAASSMRALSSSSVAASTTGYGGFLLGALPVVFSNFSANLSAGQKVVLSWTTQQELNTARFDIEKSANGISWQTVVTVTATGNSSTPVSYSTTDLSPAKGANYYRIVIVDADGKTSFSTVKNVRINALGTVSIYPNPATNTVNVSLGEAPVKDWNITIVNFSGQVVLNKIISSNTTTVTLPVNTFANGHYDLRISTGGTVQSNKLIINHP